MIDLDGVEIEHNEDGTVTLRWGSFMRVISKEELEEAN